MQSAAEIAAAWKNGLTNATPKMTAAVNAVTVAPGQAAARQKDVWAQNTANAKDKWATNTAAIPLGQWQSDMINKGIPRIASGAAAAEDKFTQFMGRLIPHIEAGVRALPARGTLDQNIQRSAQMIRHLATFKG